LSVVSAVDFTIGPNTSGGLKKAVEIAGDGDTIYMRNGVYTCDDNRGIVINKSVSIQGKGKDVVIDAQGKDRIFTLAYWIEKNISSLPNYSVTLKNLTMINGRGSFSGGAIYMDNGFLGDPTHDSIPLKQNKLSVIGCNFINNHAISGGAIYSANNIINCTFNSNSASGYGGGAIILDTYDSIVTDSIFTNNSAEGLGGGAIESRCKNLTVKNCIFKNNTAWFGGAIAGEGDYETISNSTFTNNKAKFGGAISQVTTIIKCTFKSNTATEEYGGAISSVKNVSSCTFSNNKAATGGGAIYGFSVLNSCTFKNNTAKNGGAAYSGFFIMNCIFSNNQAEYGGAINTFGRIVSNSTFKNNKATFKGGAIYTINHVRDRDNQKIISSKFENNIAGKIYNAITYKIGLNYKNVSLSNVKISPKEGTNLMPDLTISKIAKGANTHVIFIKNIGLANSKKSVLGVYDGKKLIKKVNVNAIGKGKTVFVIVTLAKKFKNKTKTFKADYNNKIKESNEKNNIRKAK